MLENLVAAALTEVHSHDGIKSTSQSYDSKLEKEVTTSVADISDKMDIPTRQPRETQSAATLALYKESSLKVYVTEVDSGYQSSNHVSTIHSPYTTYQSTTTSLLCSSASLSNCPSPIPPYYDHSSSSSSNNSNTNSTIARLNHGLDSENNSSLSLSGQHPSLLPKGSKDLASATMQMQKEEGRMIKACLEKSLKAGYNDNDDGATTTIGEAKEFQQPQSYGGLTYTNGKDIKSHVSAATALDINRQTNNNEGNNGHQIRIQQPYSPTSTSAAGSRNKDVSYFSSRESLNLTNSGGSFGDSKNINSSDGVKGGTISDQKYFSCDNLGQFHRPHLPLSSSTTQPQPQSQASVSMIDSKHCANRSNSVRESQSQNLTGFTNNNNLSTTPAPIQKQLTSKSCQAFLLSKSMIKYTSHPALTDITYGGKNSVTSTSSGEGIANENNNNNGDRVYNNVYQQQVQQQQQSRIFNPASYGYIYEFNEKQMPEHCKYPLSHSVKSKYGKLREVESRGNIAHNTNSDASSTNQVATVKMEDCDDVYMRPQCQSIANKCSDNTTLSSSSPPSVYSTNNNKENIPQVSDNNQQNPNLNPNHVGRNSVGYHNTDYSLNYKNSHQVNRRRVSIETYNPGSVRPIVRSNVTRKSSHPHLQQSDQQLNQYVITQHQNHNHNHVVYSHHPLANNNDNNKCPYQCCNATHMYRISGNSFQHQHHTQPHPLSTSINRNYMGNHQNHNPNTNNNNNSNNSYDGHTSHFIKTTAQAAASVQGTQSQQHHHQQHKNGMLDNSSSFTHYSSPSNVGMYSNSNHRRPSRSPNPDTRDVMNENAYSVCMNSEYHMSMVSRSPSLRPVYANRNDSHGVNPADEFKNMNTNLSHKTADDPCYVPRCGNRFCKHSEAGFVPLILSPYSKCLMIPPDSVGCISTPSLFGYVSGHTEAEVIFKAVKEGKCRMVKSRLNSMDRTFVREGQIFVYDEFDSGIKRWTDGLDWRDSYWQFNKKSMLYKQAQRVKINGKYTKIELPNGLKKRVVADPNSHLRLVCYFISQK